MCVNCLYTFKVFELLLDSFILSHKSGIKVLNFCKSVPVMLFLMRGICFLKSRSESIQAFHFVCIFIPFMLIIIYEGVKFFNLFRRYRKEQMDEMQAERDKIEAEKAENAKMLEELKVLKPADIESLYLIIDDAAQARVTALLL